MPLYNKKVLSLGRVGGAVRRKGVSFRHSCRETLGVTSAWVVPYPRPGRPSRSHPPRIGRLGRVGSGPVPSREGHSEDPRVPGTMDAAEPTTPE